MTPNPCSKKGDEQSDERKCSNCRQLMAKSFLPDGLGLSDPDESGHQHVIPTTEMSFEDFQEKLNDIPWEKHENGSGGGNGGGGGSGGTVE